jgi:diguanylate cyclase (GGDEF)-like protein/PAS domain S-box-containing protein
LARGTRGGARWSSTITRTRTQPQAPSGAPHLAARSGALPSSSPQVLLGTLLSAVFALRVVGRVDHALFIWPVSAVTLGLAIPYCHAAWQKRWALKLAAALGFLLAAALVGMPFWLAGVLSLLTWVDLILGRLTLGTRLQTFDDLKQRSNILRFVLLAVGVPVLRQPLFETWAMSILANSLGFAVLFPLVLFLRKQRSLRSSQLLPPYRLQPMLAAAAFLAVVSYIFAQDNKPFLFMVFPPLVLVLFTMGLEGAIFSSVALCIIGWIGTAHGHGPICLARGTPLQRLITLQVFVWVCQVTALPIGALLDERRRAERETAAALLEKNQSLEENRRLYTSLKASNELFKAFMSHGPFASYIKDEEGAMIFYNKFLADRGGVTEQAWIGLRDDQIWPPGMAAAFRRHDLTVLQSKCPSESDDVSPGPEGTSVFWKTLKFVYYDEDRGRHLLAGVSFDVTLDVLREAALEDSLREKARLAQQIDASRHLLENFLHHNPTQAYVKDEQGRFVFYNREVERFFGISSTAWLGRTVAEVRPAAEARRYVDQDQRVLSSGQKLEDIDQVEDLHGRVHQFKSVKFAYKDIDGRTMLAKIAQDITEQIGSQRELAQANRRLTLLATTDSLTGLSTRRVFEERAEIEFSVARRNRRSLSMLVMDIDSFKYRNDTHGHAAGDEALKILGTVIAASVRQGDVAARLGGEEFGLLLPDTDAIGAICLAERFRSMLHLAEHGPLALTVSVGAATLDMDTSTWEQMLAQADEAMYQAKRNGKDRAIHHRTLAPQSLALPAG